MHKPHHALALSAVCLLGALAGTSQASTVALPASIFDHGSFITDTVRHLDWYKFSNDANTVGMAYNAVLSAQQFAGWFVADLAQVQGLQAQFGWVADSHDFGGNDNFGLTQAMMTWLGYTAVEDTAPTSNPFAVTSHYRIQAMTSDWSQDPLTLVVSQNITTSEYKAFHNVQTGAHSEAGDLVEGEYSEQSGLTPTAGVGTWLFRPSTLVQDPCPGTGAPVCGGELPEPGSITLVGLGLLGLAVQTVRRSRSLSR